MRTLASQKILRKIIKRSKMLERENFLGEKLAELLVYDVLFGMGVRGKFKGTMKRNYTQLTESLDYYMKKHQVEKKEDLIKIYENMNESTHITKPKYIYLNTLVHTKKELLDKLKEASFSRVKNNQQQKENECDESHSNDDPNIQIDIKTIIKNLKNFQFYKDNLVKNMLIFSPDSLLNKNHQLFSDGHLMQIDKVNN